MTPRDESSGDNAGEQPFDFISQLPGDEETWRKSDAGPPSKWSKGLQAFSAVVASLTYPAAIFNGDQLMLFHNTPWAENCSIEGQGHIQSGKLPADVWSALQASLQGKQPKRISCRQMLKSDRKGQEEYKEGNNVLLSPLFGDSAGDKAAGVLAQLIPDPKAQGRGEEQSTDNKVSRTKRASSSVSEINGIPDDFPLNEHPFFYRFAEMLPTGLAILNDQAEATYVSQHFYELTTHQDEDKSFTAWPRSIHPEDYEKVMDAYREAFRTQTELRTEFRSLGSRHPWRLLLLTPLGDENLKHLSLGGHHGFICLIVDISSEKSAELAERKAAEEAQARKVQQERFIDMISHEIRNPLSAILHCTEDIEAAVDCKSGPVDVDSIGQAVETINICINHQRNIVNDVLSYSKLDAGMLSLAPKPYNADRQIADFLKMFQPEFRKQSVQYDYCIDKSYADLAIDWIMADMARIGQVLVNLVTNAIKFTARSPNEKKVTVSLGASRERPTSYPPNVVFFGDNESVNHEDGTDSAEWGQGEALFIMISIKDTGIGISEDNQKRLFERFQQATPKTSSVYGGSGLGLFISRKLCHIHGGEIGVASVEGSGSTFGFFIKVKRTESSPTSSEQIDNAENDANEKVEEQIETNGLTSPQEVDPAMMPDSLFKTPVIETNQFPQNDDGLDGRYKKTAEIASQLEGAESDQILDSHSALAPENSEDQKLELTGKRNGTTDITTSSDRRRHVLLAEDNIVNQRIVLRRLQSKGYNVTAAIHGREAVEHLTKAHREGNDEKGAFDIILMDQEMPELDGNAATKEIRGLERGGELRRMPILGVTANVRDDQTKEMIASGMDDVISKPYKIDELVTKMEKLLDSKGS